ncbi:MAG: hypothetical protein ABIS29_07720 [Vicinamibacterales bacterium]
MVGAIRASIGVALVLLAAAPARAQQTIAAELDLTTGYSGEEIRAAAAQLRLTGEAPGGIEFFAEAAWGDRWAGGAPLIGVLLSGVDPIGTDVFGAAYPYSGHVRLMEIYAERYFQLRGAMLGVRAGRFRMPFGIYSRSDYGYSGFLRPPLIRYDGYFGVSNNWLEDGAMFTAGVPQLFVEASVSRPHDVGFAIRREGVDTSIRAQGYRGQFVFGASHARSKPYLSPRFAVGRQAFSGIDMRWAHPSGLQARGEFLKGRSYEGVSTTGWYLDGIVHRPGMGPFTAVIRGERLDYTAPPPRDRRATRLTLGTRIRLQGPVTLQLNYVRQHGDLPRLKSHSVDFSATYSFRMDR